MNLLWTESTDNVGVTSYLVERCEGLGCSNFTQVATVPGTSNTYNDKNLKAATVYTYRVRATDFACNLGDYSNTATATTTLALGPGL